MLHEKMEALLELLSFSKQLVQKISGDARSLMKDATKDKQNILEARTRQLADINKKFDRLEERLMDDEIDGGTYKRWHEKYSKEKSILQNEIREAGNGNGSINGKWQRLERLLPELTNLKSIYNIAPLSNKQSLIKGVFKHNLTFSDGAFRTPSVEPAFTDNSLIAKEKGLLFVEQPSAVWDKVPCSSP
jgi:site-specific DNA recombinase